MARSPESSPQFPIAVVRDRQAIGDRGYPRVAGSGHCIRVIGGQVFFLNRTLEALPAPETGIFVSELWRQRGELMIAGDRSNPKVAEHDLRRALRIATAQRAVIYRLRAAIALARLLAASGRVEEAHAELIANADATGLDPGLEELSALRSLSAEIVR